MKIIKRNDTTYIIGNGTEIAPILSSISRKSETENRHNNYAEPYYLQGIEYGLRGHTRMHVNPNRIYVLSLESTYNYCEFFITRIDEPQTEEDACNDILMGLYDTDMYAA